ncbi:MAG: N-acetylmuramoyl-L-alanine amidase [Pseudoflavonifractor sp.]
MKKAVSIKILAALCAAALVLLFCPAGSNKTVAVNAFAFARHPGETVVIDAGHGGEDGGAVSVTGVPESGINLAIALKLDRLLALYGVRTKLLRETDVSIHDSSAVTLRQRKVSDLHNRVAMIEQTENAVLISIHQNKFERPNYHGAQVFYANEELTRPFAVFTQGYLREVLDPENTRTAARIPNSVYLMNHITCRAILVECGFLSNPKEDLLLQSGIYQTKVASALTGAFLQFQDLNIKGELPNEG